MSKSNMIDHVLLALTLKGLSVKSSHIHNVSKTTALRHIEITSKTSEVSPVINLICHGSTEIDGYWSHDMLLSATLTMNTPTDEVKYNLDLIDIIDFDQW